MPQRPSCFDQLAVKGGFKKLPHRLRVDAVGDEDEAGVAICARPAVEDYRRVDDVLDRMNDAGAFRLIAVVYKTLDPEQPGSRGHRQQAKKRLECVSSDRQLAGDRKGADSSPVARERRCSRLGGPIRTVTAITADGFLERQPADHVVAERGGCIDALPKQLGWIESGLVGVVDRRRGIERSQPCPEALDIPERGRIARQIGLGQDDAVGESDLLGGLKMVFDR